MSTTTQSIASVLNSLIETCKDGQEGLRAAAEKAKIDLGEGAEISGRFGGAVRRGWLDLKCAFMNGDEHTILVEVGGRAAIGRCVVF